MKKTNTHVLRLLGGAVVKNLAGLQETQETRVSSLGQEDPLEKEMETQSSIVAWEILWTEEPDALWSKCCKESNMTKHTHTKATRGQRQGSGIIHSP